MVEDIKSLFISPKVLEQTKLKVFSLQLSDIIIAIRNIILSHDEPDNDTLLYHLKDYLQASNRSDASQDVLLNNSRISSIHKLIHYYKACNVKSKSSLKNEESLIILTEHIDNETTRLVDRLSKHRMTAAIIDKECLEMLRLKLVSV